jgi:hypothetical protein
MPAKRSMNLNNLGLFLPGLGMARASASFMARPSIGQAISGMAERKVQPFVSVLFFKLI